MLPSAGIKASADWSQNVEAQSPCNPTCSLSTLRSLMLIQQRRYRLPRKTRYWWVANPCQTGFSPVRLLALRLGAQSRFVILISNVFQILRIFRFIGHLDEVFLLVVQKTYRLDVVTLEQHLATIFSVIIYTELKSDTLPTVSCQFIILSATCFTRT